jgi:hypothetical protein
VTRRSPSRRSPPSPAEVRHADLQVLPDGQLLAVRETHPASGGAADVVDGCAHLEQVSVHPDHAHRGPGRELIGASRCGQMRSVCLRRP